MWLGPLNPKEFGAVRSVLEGAAVPFEIFSRPDDAGSKIDEYRAAVPHSTANAFSLPNVPGFLWIYLEPAETLRVGAELRALGFDAIPAVAPEEDESSWHCPHCDFDGDAASVCPTHGAKLISFEEHVARRRARSRKTDFWFSLLMLLGIGGLLAVLAGQLFL